MKNKEFYIFNTRIDNKSEMMILKKIRSFLQDDQFHHITTINPEFLLEARKNNRFRKILNSADLNVADGVGIFFAFLWHGKKLRARITGSDLIQTIMVIAQKQHLHVHLVINKDGLSSWQEIKQILKDKYPHTRITGENISFSCKTKRDLPASANIVFCNFGAPQQEFFLSGLKNASNSSVNIGVGVGGAFDFLTLKVPRAPKMLRQWGLEWAFRLFKQPHRLGRIFNAIVIFPFLIVLSNNKLTSRRKVI